MPCACGTHRKLDRVNVGGTRAMVAAAAGAGVERIVYTSSAATLGERRGTVGHEGSEHRGSYVSAYERSKHRAEVAALEDADRLGVPLVAVNPSSVQGPGRTGGTARILLGYLTGRLRFAVDTRLSVVAIGDVVAAHLRAEDAASPGERYVVSGWTTTVSDAVSTLERVTGVTRRVRMLPAWTLGVGRPPGRWGLGAPPEGRSAVSRDGASALPRARLRRQPDRTGVELRVHPARGVADGDGRVVPPGRSHRRLIAAR